MDYGLGNLFSVKRACEVVGLRAVITSDQAEIRAADALIIPGVGSFSHAMESLCRLGLVDPLLDAASSGKPLIGICLGMQLLMAESDEFGRNRGLGILDGQVVGFDKPTQDGRPLKVPHVGWNRIRAAVPDRRPPNHKTHPPGGWNDSPLAGLKDGSSMYFLHSFYVLPRDQSAVLSLTRYGDVQFCSALRHGNVFACQFHPERSGTAGLRLYRSFAAMVREYRMPKEEADALATPSPVR